MGRRASAVVMRALSRLRPMGSEGAQIMRMARDGMSAGEVESLVDWIAAELGRSPAELPDWGSLGRLEYVVRHWLDGDQRRQIEGAMAGRSIRGAPLMHREIVRSGRSERSVRHGQVPRPAEGHRPSSPAQARGRSGGQARRPPTRGPRDALSRA